MSLPGFFFLSFTFFFREEEEEGGTEKRVLVAIDSISVTLRYRSLLCVE